MMVVFAWKWIYLRQILRTIYHGPFFICGSVQFIKIGIIDTMISLAVQYSFSSLQKFLQRKKNVKFTTSSEAEEFTLENPYKMLIILLSRQMNAALSYAHNKKELSCFDGLLGISFQL